VGISARAEIATVIDRIAGVAGVMKLAQRVLILLVRWVR
jgi:hypothetical protein